jgi:hypothetical protein
MDRQGVFGNEHITAIVCLLVDSRVFFSVVRRWPVCRGATDALAGSVRMTGLEIVFRRTIGEQQP